MKYLFPKITIFIIFSQNSFSKDLAKHDLTFEYCYFFHASRLDEWYGDLNNGGSLLFGYHNRQLPVSLSIVIGYQWIDGHHNEALYYNDTSYHVIKQKFRTETMPVLIGLGYIYPNLEHFQPYCSLSFGVQFRATGYWPIGIDIEWDLVPKIGVLFPIHDVVNLDLSFVHHFVFDSDLFTSRIDLEKEYTGICFGIRLAI